MKKYRYHLLGLLLLSIIIIVFYHSDKVETQFEDAKRFSENTAPVKISNKYGYIDKEGKLAIAPQYDDANPFVDNFAKIKVENSWGVINKNNDIILEPIYDSIFSYSPSISILETNGKKGVCDDKYNIILQPFYTDIDIYENEYFVTKNNESMEIFNYKGKKAISGTFDDISIYSEINTIYLKKNNKWAIYDLKTGKYLTQFEYDDIIYKYLDKHIVINNKKYGIIDSSGNVLVDSTYDYIDTEDGKTFSYKEDNLYGFLDSNGDIFIPAKYKNAKPFEKGLAKVYKNIEGISYVGFINEFDEIIIDFKYRLAHKKGEQIAVYKNTDQGYKWGIIDSEGNTLIKPRYDEIKFTGDKFTVMSDYKFGLLDKNYKTIVPAKYKEIKLLGEKSIGISDKNLDIYDSKGNPQAHIEFDNYQMINYDLIKIRIDDSYGVVDITGKMIVPTIYQDVEYGYLYKNFWVKYSDKWGLLDIDGNIILEPEYDNFKFSQNIYPVKIDENWIYVNDSGQNILTK